MSDFVKVRVPGTTANCGPGFDVMGIACSIYNELEMEQQIYHVMKEIWYGAL